MTEANNEFALALLAGLEATAPLFEAAEGMKADLERRGWSPTAAETIALQWVQLMLVHIWSKQ